MNEMASQVIGGAVSQLQVLEIYSFLRGYYAYMEIWTPVVGEILVLKIAPTNRHYIHAVAIYKMLKLRPCSSQASSKNVSIFYEREQSVCRNHRSQSLQGSWIWKSHVSTVSMDLTFMLTKWVKALVESLLTDGHYNQCNSDFVQW